MNHSTKNSIHGWFYDFLGLNKPFRREKPKSVCQEPCSVVSPVNGKVKVIGKIDEDLSIISKHGKEVYLENLIGDYADKFKGKSYINFYLGPKSDHNLYTPYEGYFVYYHKRERKGLLRVLIALENIFNTEMFSRAVKKNASISTVFRTGDFLIAMTAVGSLNVDRIHVECEDRIYSRGENFGYFSLGSAMLMCFPSDLEIKVKEGDKVNVGQELLRIYDSAA